MWAEGMPGFLSPWTQVWEPVGHKQQIPEKQLAQVALLATEPPSYGEQACGFRQVR
jgi:hypothetical protein